MQEIKKIFRDEGLPTDLAYLPLVESSFNVSRALGRRCGRHVAVHGGNRQKILAHR